MATAMVVGCGSYYTIADADETAAGTSAATGTSVTASSSNANTTTNNSSKTTNKAEDVSSDRVSTNYTNVSSGYTLKDYKGDDVSFMVDKCVTGEGVSKLTSEIKDYSYANQVLKLSTGDSVDLEINVSQGGLYDLYIDYFSVDDSILPVSMDIMVDNDYPFYEMRNLKFETTWSLPEEKVKDRYNKEVVAVPEKVFQWESKAVGDSSYRYSDPLRVQLKKGKHVLHFNIQEGNFLLGNVTLKAPKTVAAYTGSEAASGSELIEIQGERYAQTNDSAIHGVTEFDSDVDPYTVGETELNTLDSDAFNSAGQKVVYKFEVATEGNYNIAMNYRQSDKTDFMVFTDIEIDGAIPNEAFRAYGLKYGAGYQQSTLTDPNGKNLTVHLTPGTHTISYQISMDNIRYVMEKIDVVMNQVNDLSLEITKVAGTNADQYRDLKLSRYIPNIEETLQSYAKELRDLEKSALKWSDSENNVAVMSSLLIAAKQLESLAENSDEIPYRVEELSTSSNSVNHYLAQAIDDLLANAIAIDRIWIYQDSAELPSMPGVFESMGQSLNRFISSFTDTSYSTRGTNKEHLQVWVNRSNQYIQIMQKLIDENFTPNTGIEVDVSVMPDQNKLVLANSAGNAPDVATGLNYTIPYELGIRGALADMTQFSDFNDVADAYEPGFFLTGTIGDKVYSMPETMNFWVLFYRKDVLEKLGIGVPNTVEDMIDMLPDLQMRGLNFYYPTAGMTLLRNFHGTTPLLVQNGGSLYGETAAEGTTFGSEGSVAGFTALTDLFTVYNMPVNIDNFYQHFRNGDMPIGIADFATYNMLKNAAPELDGSWEIHVVPGTEQADGSIDRTVCGQAEATVIFKSEPAREKKAWEFIKWWSSVETQAEYGQTLQISYGDDYIWPTANMAALDQLPLDSKDKKVIEETAKNVVDVARVPGTYLLEREVSNAFNDVCVNGADIQTRIDTAVKNVNHEFDRKLEEFGYNDSDGNVIEEYKIPTIDSVRQALGRTDSKQ
ncbi:MAG: extracellular solute-binding protein [Eubacterium sp.]|nr:extracellular solute-binding protein [Eubacterium sp.]